MTVDDPTLPRAERPFALAAMSAVLVGAVIRLVLYCSGFSLWEDEVLLSLNIARRGARELLRPLAHDQAAPVLFLWVERLLTHLGGVNEYTLRFTALVAGVLLPLAVWRVGRRIVGDPAAAVATIVAALSPALIMYSNQVKPYSSDALVAIALAGLAWRVREEPASRRAWALLTAGGVLGMLGSYPAMFTVAACGLFLLLSPGVLRAAGWRMPALAAAAFATTALLIYVAFVRPAATSPYLSDYWENTYLRVSAPNLGERLFVAVRAFMTPLPIPKLLVRPRLVLPVFALGVGALYFVRGRAVAVLCAGSLLVGLAASAAGRYPVTGRLFLFAAPFTILVMSSALAFALSRVERRVTGITALAGLVVCLALLNQRVPGLATARVPIEGRGAVLAVARARAHEPVYVAPAALPTWTFYTTDWTHPDERYLDSIAHVSSSGGVAFLSAEKRRGPVDPAIGRALVLDRGTGRDLIGVSPGIPSIAGVSLTQRADSGWAESEAARMLATCARHLWIVSTLRVRTEGEPLVRALVAQGGRLEYRYDELNAAAFKLRLPPVASCPQPDAASPITASATR